MLELTVSKENYEALINARPYEDVHIKCKCILGVVALEKRYHKVPKVTKYIGQEIMLVETTSKEDFNEAVNYGVKRGFKVTSTSCSPNIWRAILIKEVNNNDKD